jgi:maltose O-acetyltransferase
MNKLIFILINKIFKKNKIALSTYMKGVSSIILGKKIKILRNVFLDCSKGGVIILKDNTTLNHFCQLVARGGSINIGKNSEINSFSIIFSGGSNIHIGENVIIGPNVTFIGYNHSFNHLDIPIKEQKNEKKDINIQNNVWIGSSCSILSGITIGEGSVIGAGSIVNKDVEPYSVNVGNPCRKIKSRLNEK